MLSIKPVNNAGDASHYYSAGDNYYLSDQGELVDASAWYGKGAARLGLSGVVEPERFLELLEGRLPSGEQLGIVDKNGEIQHRPATDLTLSAPKSVSNVALVGGDARLLQAHHEASRETMDVVEVMAAEARITINGKTGFEKTGNLVCSLFQHTTSRELDANLHTHCLIMNMTERSDGLWRSLSSRSKNDKTHLENGFREILYQNQHYFGLVYTSLLAKKVCALGYDIEIKDRYGNFEIKGVSEAYIEQTSKRRGQITDSLDAKGFSSAKAAEKANLDTRRSKNAIDDRALMAYWKAEAEEHGVDFDRLIESSKQKGKGSIESGDAISISENAREAVSDAIEQLSPFRTQIKHGDLVRMAFMFARGTIHHTELEADIAERIKSNDLLGVASEYYTTGRQAAQERQFIKQFKGTMGDGFELDNHQSGVASEILRNRDRVQLIDVKGLTHEKNLIEELVHQSEAAGLGTYVLHVGRLQANRLGDSIGRDNSSVWKWIKNCFKGDLVQTVAGFQSRYEASSSKKQDVVIVHDAQKLSYQDLMSLENLTEKTKSKLVLLNNMRSTEGYSAGSPIKALKEAGFKAIESTSTEKEASVELIYTKKAHQDLAIAYGKLAPERRQTTKVVAITNKDEATLTALIREQLKVEGILSIQSKAVSVLSIQTLSDVQKKSQQFYDIGDQVTLNPFTREQSAYRVIGKTREAIQLQDNVGRERILNLSDAVASLVTKTKPLEFAIGDNVVTEKNIYRGRAGVIERGQSFQVAAIREEGVMFMHNQSRLYFSNEELGDLSLSYNYVRKPSQLTEKSSEIFVALTGYQVNKNTIGELSEFSPKMRLFTNDKARAMDGLDKEKISWTIGDVAEGKPSLVYRDSQFGHLVIQKDLEYLSKALSKNEKNLDETSIASVAVAYAHAKLGAREAAIEHKALLREAMVFSMGKTTLSVIEKTIEEKAKQGEFIHADTFWVSKESLALEKKILEHNQSEQNKLEPIAVAARLLSLPNGLTQGQKDAISLGVTTRDRFTSVQGLAGVGKTTMMRELQTIAKEAGFGVVGLAPMHSSKDALKDAGIESMTIARFLIDDKSYSPQTLFIVDEASMVGNQDYFKLQTKVKSLNARILLAGDITQLQSQSSGIPHELTVQTATQKIAFMHEIMRQNESPDLKKAVMHASNRELKESFATLAAIDPEQYVKRSVSTPFPNRSVIEVNCYDEKNKTTDYGRIYRAIATDYLTRTPEHQDGTLVIAHTHEDRREINALIREGLQEQGRLSTHEISTQRLSVKSLSQADLVLIQSYKASDILRFGRDYSVAKKGEYFTVERVDSNSHQLHCRAEQGELYSINPATIAEKSRMTVYKSETAPLAIGDKIRLRLTHEERGHISNKEYVVKNINESQALLHNEEDSLALQLDKKHDAHWDYAYTSTAFAAQGSTSTFVLALELAKRTEATTHRSHEIDITRAKLQATIYTENESALVGRFEQLKGDKTSAYQTVEKVMAQRLIEKELLSKPLAKEMKPHLVSAEELNQALTSQIETLAHRLLGDPNRGLSSKSSLRYGSKGSLSINVKNGLWYNFESGEKGNAIQLIAHQMGFSDFKDTIMYAKDFLTYQDTPSPSSKTLPKTPSSNAVKESPNKQAYAKKLVEKSVPIQGTLAERYLIQYRGLSQYHNASLRFIPEIISQHGDKKIKVPALLSIARNEKGELNHVQVIRLNPLTGNKDTEASIIKQTYGKMNGCMVELNKNKDSDVTYLTEGVETGLSILEHDKTARVCAVLSKSNFLNVNPNQLSKQVILCLDNDGEQTWKDSIIEKAVHRLQESGKVVSFVMPEKVGDDFNDVLKNDGVQALRQRLLCVQPFMDLVPSTGSQISSAHVHHHNRQVPNTQKQAQLQVEKTLEIER